MVDRFNDSRFILERMIRLSIKKNYYHVLFFIIIFELESFILITLCFFLGFEISSYSISILLIIIIAIIIFGIIIFSLYLLLCQTYYEFTNNSIKIIKKGSVIDEIICEKIKYCEYYSFISLLFLDSKGGNLIVYYWDDGVEKSIEISFIKRLIKKINVKNLIIKPVF